MMLPMLTENYSIGLGCTRDPSLPLCFSLQGLAEQSRDEISIYADDIISLYDPGSHGLYLLLVPLSQMALLL